MRTTQVGAVSISTYAEGKHHEEIFSSQENLSVFADFGGWACGLLADEVGIILSRVFIQQRAKHKSWRLLELQPGNNATQIITRIPQQ